MPVVKHSHLLSGCFGGLLLGGALAVAHAQVDDVAVGLKLKSTERLIEAHTQAVDTSLSLKLTEHNVEAKAGVVPKLPLKGDPAMQFQKAAACSDALSGQSLTLRELFASFMLTHPQMQAARSEIRASTEDLQAAEYKRWPTISVTAESDPGAGHTASVVQRALNVDQTLWDFGRNTALISGADIQRQTAIANVYVQQMDLMLQIVNAWQSMRNSYERVKVAEESLERLHTYLRQIERRVEAQASPRIDLELSRARIMQTDVELTTAQTQLRVAVKRLEQLATLSSLLQRVECSPPTWYANGADNFYSSVLNIDLEAYAAELPSVKKARLDLLAVQARARARQAENWPVVYARINQPIGKTSTSTITEPSLFLGLRYSTDAGLGGVAAARAQATRIEAQEQVVDAAMRDGYQSLQNEYEEFANARSRLSVLEKAVSGSELVLESYERQFQAGRKTWQDLLNAMREVAQNKYSVADAQASLEGSMLRLDLRLGRSTHYP